MIGHKFVSFFFLNDQFEESVCFFIKSNRFVRILQVLLRQKHNDQSAWQTICVQIRFSRTNGRIATAIPRK